MYETMILKVLHYMYSLLIKDKWTECCNGSRKNRWDRIIKVLVPVSDIL